MTQVMNLLFLAPDIQEQILFSTAGPEDRPFSLRRIRCVVAEAEWDKQRELRRLAD